VIDILLTDRATGLTLFQCVVPAHAMGEALTLCVTLIQRARFTLDAPITLEVRARP